MINTPRKRPSRQLSGPELLELSRETIVRILHETNDPEWDILSNHKDFNDSWVVLFLKRSRFIPRHIVQQIYQNKEFRKSYRISVALLQCKFAPANITMNIVHYIRWIDLVKALRLPYLNGAIRQKVVTRIMEKFPRLAKGEKTTLARQAPKPLILALRGCNEAVVIKELLGNPQFTYEDAMFIANYEDINEAALGELAKAKKWTSFKEVRYSLLRNERTPNAFIYPLAASLSEFNLRNLLKDTSIKLFTRRIIHRVLEEELYKERGDQ